MKEHVMKVSGYLLLATLAAVVSASAACTDRAADETKRATGAVIDTTQSDGDNALDATKKAGNQTAEAAKDVALTTVDKTKEMADQIAEKTQEIAATTGAAVTDGWITTKVKAKFADETVLKGSDINVDTTDHVVTLRGTVPSGAAKTRAAEIARGTERVTRVVNQLVVN
jgi:hyperosmotically inducible protein